MQSASCIIRGDDRNMQIKGAVFDFDGTLFDSMPVWEQAGAVYLHAIGKEPEETLAERLRTMSLAQSAAYLKEAYEIGQTVEEIVAGINRTIEDAYRYELLPKEGVTAFLEKLKKEQVVMGIATASERLLIEAALKRCHMEQYFSQIFTCFEVGYGKERPDIFRCAMEQLHLNRKNLLIFEDAYHAIHTAKKDGFLVAAVADASEPRQKAILQISDCYLENFSNTDACWNAVAGVFSVSSEESKKQR